MNPPAPGPIRTRSLKWANLNLQKYLSCFSKRDFYRTARELSICDVDGLMSFNLNNIRTVEDVRNHSALMAYWLDIENAALKTGHWGVSAWYFDDIVERAHAFFRNCSISDGLNLGQGTWT